MTNQNQAKPASNAAKRVIELWNSALNSFFLTVETEDGPNPPEIVVNVRSSEERYLGTVGKELHFLARIMETASVQHIPLVKNAEGEMILTEDGQKLLDESGESTDLTSALLRALAMVFIEEPKNGEGFSAEDLTVMVQLLAELNPELAGEVPLEGLRVREKVIGQEDGKDIRHITINVLAEQSDADKDLKELQAEFVSLYKAGKITVALKPYTSEEVEALQKSMGMGSDDE